jgi:threonine/homoserine/homoserine lactone efflux protein
VIDTGRLVAFVVTSFVLIITPGPSVLFVVSRALAWGRRAALLTAVGNEAGLALSLGLGIVIQRSVLIFSVLKVVGAAYLIYLGVHAFRNRTRLTAAMAQVDTTPRSSIRVARQGFVVGVTNPKIMVFLTAILPEFVNRSHGHVPGQLLLLGMAFVAIALVCDSAWGVAAGSARDWFARSPRRLEIVGGTGGLVMIGLGVDLAATGRRR